MSSTTDKMNTVEEVFASMGIPATVWQPIETVESGGDPLKKNMGTTSNPEYSVGLFQLNKDGGLGAAYSEADLYNSVTNATIAAKAMKPAYDAGVAKGLTGYDLTQYVAYNSGWPTTKGVGALQSDPVVQAYEPMLEAAYGNPDVSGDTGLFKSVKDSVSVTGNTTYYVVLGGLVLGGVFFFTRIFTVK